VLARDPRPDPGRAPLQAGSGCLASCVPEERSPRVAGASFAERAERLRPRANGTTTSIYDKRV
jgi:hypothetical protein